MTSSTRPSPVSRRPSVTAPTMPACAWSSSAIVSSIVSGGEQVPGGDRVVLADAVAAVLGLVVRGGRPLELEERDVRRARERDAVAGGERRADEQLRPQPGLELLDRALALGGAVAAEQVAGAREALEDLVLHLRVVREDDERLAGLEEVVDPRRRGGELAARGQALERPDLREALGAQRRARSSR